MEDYMIKEFSFSPKEIEKLKIHGRWKKFNEDLVEQIFVNGLYSYFTHQGDSGGAILETKPKGDGSHNFFGIITQAITMFDITQQIARSLCDSIREGFRAMG